MEQEFNKLRQTISEWDSTTRVALIASLFGALGACIAILLCKLMHCYCCSRRSALDDLDNSDDEETIYLKGEPYKNVTRSQLLYSRPPPSYRATMEQKVHSESMVQVDGVEINRSNSRKSRKSQKSRLASSVTDSSNQTSRRTSIVNMQSLNDVTAVDGLTVRPHLTLTLEYNSESSKLSLYIKQAFGLHPQLDGKAGDYYMRAVLVKNFNKNWLRRVKPDHLSVEDLTSPSLGYKAEEVRSSTIRRSLNPIYNEMLTFTMSEKEKKNSVLKIAACHIDRGQEIIAGEFHLLLSTLDLSQLTELTKVFDDYRPELGEIQLGLCYLPTAERIRVSVFKAQGLKLPTKYNNDNGKEAEINPYIKATLMHRTRRVDRYRSITCQTRSPSIVFGEAGEFNFDIPRSELERVSLMIAICHDQNAIQLEGNIIQSNNRSPSSTSSTSNGYGTAESPEMQVDEKKSDVGKFSRSSSTASRERRRSTNNDCTVKAAASQRSKSHINMTDTGFDTIMENKTIVLGRVVLGAHTMEDNERAHWLEMANNLRSMAIHWHRLLP